MERKEYDILKKISLQDSEIIRCHMSDPIYKFCITNGIDNLGDFIEEYNKQKFLMNSRHNFFYFDGIIDLLNLIFFEIKLPESKLLSKKISFYESKDNIKLFAYIKEDDKYNIGCSDNKSLKRLGFNSNEIKIILKYVLLNGKEMTVISAIKSYLDNLNFEKMSNIEEIFITKLHILSEFYNKYVDEIEVVDSYKFYQAQEDLNKLNDLYLRIDVLNHEIEKISKEFLDKVSKFSQDDNGVKKLIKDFKQINCK